MFENITAGQWMNIVLVLLLAVSEILPFSQKVESNGIFQGVINILKALVGKKV